MTSNLITPLKHLGNWLARDDDTVYQAATDGFVLMYGEDTNLTGYTDAANPPITIRALTTANTAADNYIAFMMAVKKLDYWEAITTTPARLHIIFWIPLEP